MAEQVRADIDIQTHADLSDAQKIANEYFSIRDALKDYILRYQWMNQMEGERVGVITVIYDHHYVGVMEAMTDIQHEYRQQISASLHIHMNDKYCLEVIIVKGDVIYIRDLTEKLMRLKGVEHVKLTSAGSGELEKVSDEN